MTLPALSQSFSTICPQIFAPACTQSKQNEAYSWQVRKIRSPSKAGRRAAFPILAGANAKAMAGVGLFAKYAFFGLTRKNPVFERSVLMYVSIKNRILTQSGQKSRVCVNQPDGLTHPPMTLPGLFSAVPAIFYQTSYAAQPYRSK